MELVPLSPTRRSGFLFKTGCLVTQVWPAQRCNRVFRGEPGVFDRVAKKDQGVKGFCNRMDTRNHSSPPSGHWILPYSVSIMQKEIQGNEGVLGVHLARRHGSWKV